MRESVKVVVLGTGQMGSGIIRLLTERPGLSIAGVYGRRAERAGLEVSSAVGLSEPLGLQVDADLANLLARARPDVAIQTTCSRLADAESELTTCLASGVDVISIAEELAWPAATSPAWAERIDELARKNGVTLLGTGVNPGFVLDLLIVALTGACARVDSITARRVNDLAPYGPSVLRSQGVGLTPEAFRQGIESGSVVGHIGFPQSIGMIASALGWTIERIEETREPIVSGVLRKTLLAQVEPGCVAGCLHTAVAYEDGHPRIRLEHPQQIHPEAEGVTTGDTIEISGTPPLRIASSPEIPGGTATIALAVNMIPKVLAAAPGLRSMTELPVPAAFVGDVVPKRERSSAPTKRRHDV
jgi:4-hydroxy-tetrahydrodipicolinate reductase